MLDEMQRQLRDDCLASAAALPDLAGRLRGHRIAVVGGTGFSGTWLAEMVAALNDEAGGNARLHLIGRAPAKWAAQHPHLKRDNISLQAADVRSPFELPHDTTLVLFAAGIADPRVHASEPQRVFQTTVHGLDNALVAASRLEEIQRFVNLSSGLVAGSGLPARALAEGDIGPLDFTRFHNLYAEARRAAESLACGHAGQHRLPVSTVRAFTFLGPYQALDAPWAMNNFIRDALSGREIRVHGEGTSRRSYLYGSDVAAWLLQACLVGQDGAAYNLGGDQPLSHADAAAQVGARTTPSPQILLRSHQKDDGRSHDFFPDLGHATKALGTRVVIDVGTAIERTMRWHAARQAAARRLRVQA
jgi:dTDP-glucose 4,6-dehydratase